MQTTFDPIETITIGLVMLSLILALIYIVSQESHIPNIIKTIANGAIILCLAIDFMIIGTGVAGLFI